jgi:FOG: TPR repeat, SEL1 subfamily
MENLPYEEILEKAETGDPDAQYKLARMFHDGDGRKVNKIEAEKWSRKSAEQGDVGAQYLLACMLYYGSGIPANIIEAAQWFGKAAEQGHKNAPTMFKFINDHIKLHRTIIKN